MRALFVALPLLLATGCVAKAKYLELEDQYQTLQGQFDQQKTTVAELEKKLAAYQERAQRALKNLEEIRKDFQPLVDKGILEVTVDSGRVVIGMAADVLFPSGSAEMSADGKANVAEVARLLSKRDHEYQVEGHTDDDPISTAAFPSNWHLGSARALNVVQHMIANGMSPDIVSAASFGEHRPVAANDSAANKKLNRRIEIVLLPDLSSMPGYDKLMEQGRPARVKKVRKPRRKKR